MQPCGVCPLRLPPRRAWLLGDGPQKTAAKCTVRAATVLPPTAKPLPPTRSRVQAADGTNEVP